MRDLDTRRNPGATGALAVAVVALVAALAAAASCAVASAGADPRWGPDRSPADGPVRYAPAELVMGADLSYVNQVLDHGGVYRDASGAVADPFALFRDRGANAVRLRLWHSPDWVRTEVYGDPATPLYSGLPDVTAAVRAAKGQGMAVNLDFHYSDTWADPGRQDVPAAWADITDLAVLEDSVYRYTRATLEHLDAEGLLPEMVQVGNEINCGMLSTNAGPGFPALDVCRAGRWRAQGAVLDAGIRAVRDVSPEIRVILHVAQPENVGPWLAEMTTTGGVTDFDIVGFSYYSKWSTEPLASIRHHVAGWRERYGKDVMLVETAYPWTLENADGYGNILGEDALVDGYPASPAGQRAYMIRLVQEVVAGGGSGVFYWEPAWITSRLRDLWGTGSSWENNTFFDFDGRVHEGIEFYTFPYDGPAERGGHGTGS